MGERCERTGGCSSFSVPPRSGLAVRLEKTPSFWMPLPKIRLELVAEADGCCRGGCGGDGLALEPIVE